MLTFNWSQLLQEDGYDWFVCSLSIYPLTLQQPLLIKNLRTDNHPPANEAMYLMTEVMSKMRMDVVEAVMSRVKNVTEIVVVSMMMQNAVSMRMMVGIVVSMLRMNVVSMMRMNVVSMIRMSLFLAVQKINVLETMILMTLEKAGLLVFGVQWIGVHLPGEKNCWNLLPSARTLICQQHVIDLSSIISDKALVKT